MSLAFDQTSWYFLEMPRTQRIIMPGVPHHVTQRGNRRQQTFFCESDYEFYLELLLKFCNKFRVDVLSYTLMSNHVHEILQPNDFTGMTKALSETHRRYSEAINKRNEWTGHLWQGRYFSVPLVEQRVETAMVYVELNAVRAGIVKDPRDYQWSSAAFRNQSFSFAITEQDIAQLRITTRTGRPNVSKQGIKTILDTTGIDLTPKKLGRPKTKLLNP